MRRALALLLLLAACGSDPVTERSNATLPSTTTTSEPAEAVRADDGLVEIELIVPAETPAGERLWATLTVRNIGDRSVWWQAGGNRLPGGVVLVGPGQPEVDNSVPPKWSGEPDDLADDLIPSGARPFQDEGYVGLDRVGRTDDSRMEELAPGEEHTRRVAADLRLGPGAPTGLLARATFVTYDEPDHYGGAGSVGPRPAVTVETSVRVVDLSPLGDAVAAFAADPGLAAFVAGTDVATVEQHWYAELAWWRGGWELTTTPEYSDDDRGQSRYRLRYDPAAGEVVDARRIWWDQSPEDDPGGTRYPTAPADDVEER